MDPPQPPSSPPPTTDPPQTLDLDDPPQTLDLDDPDPQNPDQDDPDEDPLESPSRPPPSSSRRAPPTRRKPTKKNKQSQRKLATIHKKAQELAHNLKVIPFVPSKTLDFAKHEHNLKKLGLWEFAHLEFDRKANCIRVDLLAKLIVGYNEKIRASTFDDVKIMVNQADLARALNLPSKKAVGAWAEEEVDWPADFVGFVEDFVSSWMLLDGDPWMYPSEVMNWIGVIKEGHPEKVDYGKLVWFMVKRELSKGAGLESCYYASHLQRLMRVQKEGLFRERSEDEVDEVIVVKGDDEEEGDVKMMGECDEVLDAEEAEMKVESDNLGVVGNVGECAIDSGGLVETREKAVEIVESSEKAVELLVELVVESSEKAVEVVVESSEKAVELVVESSEKAVELVVESSEKVEDRVASPEKAVERVDSPEKAVEKAVEHVESLEKVFERVESPEKAVERAESPEKAVEHVESLEKPVDHVENPEKPVDQVENIESVETTGDHVENLVAAGDHVVNLDSTDHVDKPEAAGDLVEKLETMGDQVEKLETADYNVEDMNVVGDEVEDMKIDGYNVEDMKMGSENAENFKTEDDGDIVEDTEITGDDAEDLRIEDDDGQIQETAGNDLMDFEPMRADDEHDLWDLSRKDEDGVGEQAHFLRHCTMAEEEGDEEHTRNDDVQLQEVEDDDEDEDDEQVDGFDALQKCNSFNGLSSGHLMQAMEPSQIPYAASHFGNQSSLELLSSRVDNDLMLGGPSSFFGNAAPKRELDHDPEIGGHSLHDSHKRMRTEGPSWEQKPPDFDLCMDQVQQWIEKTRMAYMSSQEEMGNHQQAIFNELEAKERSIQQLKLNIDDLQRKRQADLTRYDNELYTMNSVVEGYRKALRSTQLKFAEYRQRFPLPAEPLYKDAGEGGVVKSVAELEKERLKQEEEERQEEVERVARIMYTQKMAENFEAEGIMKLEGFLERVEMYQARVSDIEKDVKLLRESKKQRKATETVDCTDPTDPAPDIEKDVKLLRESKKQRKATETVDCTDPTDPAPT